MTNYEALSSKLRVKPTFTAAEEVIRKDFKLKLPSRRYIRLWNSPEISQFRGYQVALDEAVERKPGAQMTELDVHKAAREANDSMPNMDCPGYDEPAEAELRGTGPTHA